MSRETSNTAKQPTERRQRAQKFLKDALAHGPKRVSDVEEAAAKALRRAARARAARADLGVVTSRANTPGSTLSVQWSPPG
jgi:cytosine/adenosine deaminase-related metal-dependent hydrolase